MPWLNIFCAITLIGFAFLFTATISQRLSTLLLWSALLLIVIVTLTSVIGVYSRRPLPTLASITIPWIPFNYIVASVITFFVYGYDKRAAGIKAWRIPEWSLHTMALLGGWPGALLAQILYDHKRNWRRKWRFQFWNWLIIALHISAWVILRYRISNFLTLSI